MSESPGRPRLRARRLQARYVVSRDQPAPERIRARLDDVARSALTRSVGAALAGVSSRDSSLWFIRRLDIECSLDGSWDADRIAAAWARQIAGAVRTVLVHGPDGDGIVRFANAGEYLARFLVEIVAGTAWSRWYFARFAGLRPLPASGVIRSALITDPTTGLAALLTLSSAELTLVAETLSPADAMRAARGLASADPGDATRVRDDAWCAVVTATEASRSSSEERLLLRACVEYARKGSAPDAAAHATCQALLRLVAVLPTLAPAHARALVDALATNAAARTIELTSVATAEVLAPLASAPKPWVAEIVASLTSRRGASSSATPVEGPRETPFGSLFLLLPQLVSLRLETHLADWASCEAVSAGSIVRFLATLAAGSGNVTRDWYDPVARDVLGIAPSVTVDRVGAWSATISSEKWSRLAASLGDSGFSGSDAGFLTLPPSLTRSDAASSAIAAVGHGLLRSFAALLPGFSRSSAIHLFVNFLDVRASLDDEPLRRVVRLGRPPLDLILRMAGLGRGMIILPWLDERPFALFPAEGL